MSEDIGEEIGELAKVLDRCALKVMDLEGDLAVVFALDER